MLKKNPKQQLEYVVYQNKICGFLLQSSYNSPHIFPQNCLFKHPLLFQNLSFWAIPNLLIMIQNQQEFQIQTNKIPLSIPILNVCSSKIM